MNGGGGGTQFSVIIVLQYWQETLKLLVRVISLMLVRYKKSYTSRIVTFANVCVCKTYYIYSRVFLGMTLVHTHYLSFKMKSDVNSLFSFIGQLYTFAWVLSLLGR